MKTNSIEERADKLYNDIAYSVCCDNDICFHPQCDGKQDAIDALTEQDNLARQEEREYCINLACEWLNDVLYDGHINSGMNKQRLLEVFRSTMERETSRTKK